MSTIKLFQENFTSNKLPLLPSLTTAFCLGIILQDQNKWTSLFLLILVTSCVFIKLLKPFILLATMLLGCITFYLNQPNVEQSPKHQYEILTIKKSSKGSYSITCKQLGDKLYAKTIFYSSTKPHLLIGDEFYLNTTVSEIKNASSYNAYLLRKGIHFSGYLADNFELITRPKFHLHRLSNTIQQQLAKQFDSLEAEHSSLLKALLLGEKSNLKNEVKEAFRVAGIAHILAISGLHIGIIFLILKIIFLPLKSRISVYTIIILMGVWCFAFISGLSSSVIRSALMISLFLIGQRFDKKTNAYNTVFFTALIMLIHSPSILFEIGFQLSFGAVLGILYFTSLINQTVKMEQYSYVKQYLLQSASVSTSAQLGTLPFTLYHFGTFPSYFLLSNIVAIPLCFLVVCTGILYLLFGFFQFSELIAPILSCLCELLLKLGKLVSSFPQASINNISYNALDSFILIVLMLTSFHFLLLKRIEWRYIWCLSLTYLSFSSCIS